MHNSPNPNMLLLLLIIIASTITPVLTQTTHTATVAGGAEPPAIYLEAEKIIPLDSRRRGFINSDPWGRGIAYIYEKDNGGIGVMVIRAYNGTVTTENYTIDNISYNEIKVVRSMIHENEIAITIFAKNNNYTIVFNKNNTIMHRFPTYYYYDNIYVMGIRRFDENSTVSIYIYREDDGYYRVDIRGGSVDSSRISPPGDVYPNEYVATTFYKNYVALSDFYTGYKIIVVDLRNMTMLRRIDLGYGILTPRCFLPWKRNLTLLLIMPHKYAEYDIVSGETVATYRYSSEFSRYTPKYPWVCPSPGLMNTGNTIVYMVNGSAYIYPVEMGVDVPIMDYRLVYLDAWFLRNSALYKYEFPVPYFHRYIILYRVHVGVSGNDTVVDTLYSKPLEPHLVYYRYVKLERGKLTTHRTEIVGITGISREEAEKLEAQPRLLFSVKRLGYPYDEVSYTRTLLASNDTLVALLVKHTEVVDTYYIVSYDTDANKTRYLYTLYEFLGYEITDTFHPRTYTWDPSNKMLYVVATAGRGDGPASTYLYALKVTGSNISLVYTVDLGGLGSGRWIYLAVHGNNVLVMHGYRDDVWLISIKDGEIEAKKHMERGVKPMMASWWNDGWLIGMRYVEDRYVYHYKPNGELQLLEEYVIHSTPRKWVHAWYNKSLLVFSEPGVHDGFAVIPGGLHDHFIMPLGTPYLQYIDGDILYTMYIYNKTLYVAAHSTATGQLIKAFSIELNRSITSLHVNGTQLYIDTYEYKPVVMKLSLDKLFEKIYEAMPKTPETTGGEQGGGGAPENASSAEAAAAGIEPVYIAAAAGAVLLIAAAYLVMRRR